MMHLYNIEIIRSPDIYCLFGTREDRRRRQYDKILNGTK